MASKSDGSPNISYLAIASIVLALIWCVGWALTLTFAIIGLNDPQGWNWLPYVVWGIWGLPVMVLSLLLGACSVWRIQSQPKELTGARLASNAVALCLLAWPIWYFTPMVIKFWWRS